MRTDDFSKAPPRGRYAAMVLAPASKAPARKAHGRGRVFAIRDGSRRLRMTMFAAAGDARGYADRTAGARLWLADPNGYANGTYVGRDDLVRIERFTPLNAEAERGMEPPAVERPLRRRIQRVRGPRPPADDRPGPMEAEALFFGETCYRSPVSWLAFAKRWFRMVARITRMQGYRGHRVYWTRPFSLGTIAFFADRDALLAMARSAEHRELMVWLTSSNAWATAGFIRFFYPDRSVDGENAIDSPSAASTAPYHVREVRSRADFTAFVRQPLRTTERDLAVPLLQSTMRAWWNGESPHPEPITLLHVHDPSDRVAGRTTVHTDRRLDDKFGGRRLLLFGATDLGRDADTGREVLGALLPELQQRARDIGASELVGPVSLLPNQAGGVITSGFDRRGFIDSAWNAEWVPRVYEEAGFVRWNESDTWIVDVARNGNPQPPTAGELAKAGIRIEHGSRRELRRLVPELRDLLNASFAQLPYYTQITPDEMAEATDGLAWLLDERLLLIARDAADAAVAFVVVIPDITAYVQRSGGRMGPVTVARMFAGRTRIREAVLLIQGTRPDMQGRGVLSLLSRQLQHGLAQGGYQTLRSTYVGRDNPASARQHERFGGEPLHGYTFYRRPVDG